MNRQPNTRRQVVVATVSCATVLACIVTATLIGDLPEALWFLLVPVGMLGGGLVCLVALLSLATAWVRGKSAGA